MLWKGIHMNTQGVYVGGDYLPAPRHDRDTPGRSSLVSSTETHRLAKSLD